MAVTSMLLVTLGADFLFLASGVIILALCIIAKSHTGETLEFGDQAIRHLLYEEFPLTAGMANGIAIIAVFILTLPGLFMPRRSWLKWNSYLIAACAAFTMVTGCYLWFMTLKLKNNLYSIYVDQDASFQELIQTSYQCCGYYNSTAPAFITDSTCPSPAAAALVGGCATQFSSYAKNFIGSLFTGLYGMVVVDAIFLLCIMCLVKSRKETERYRHIDDKLGFSQM